MRTATVVDREFTTRMGTVRVAPGARDVGSDGTDTASDRGRPRSPVAAWAVEPPLTRTASIAATAAAFRQELALLHRFIQCPPLRSTAVRRSGVVRRHGIGDRVGIDDSGH